MRNKFIVLVCPDCGVEEGAFHLDNCDMEYCTKCKKQTLAYGRCKGAQPERFFKVIGFHCERCNEYLPRMQMVTDKEWEIICGSTYSTSCVLCVKCIAFIWRHRTKKPFKMRTRAEFISDRKHEAKLIELARRSRSMRIKEIRIK